MKQQKRIELRFMDIGVKLEGYRNLENKAWGLLSVMIQDRIRLMELTQGDYGEGDIGDMPKKKKKPLPEIQPEISMYQ